MCTRVVSGGKQGHLGHFFIDLKEIQKNLYLETYFKKRSCKFLFNRLLPLLKEIAKKALSDFYQYRLDT